jgi:hypothetical protein
MLHVTQQIVKYLALLDEQQILKGLTLLFLEESSQDFIEVTTENGLKTDLIVISLFGDFKELHQLIHQRVVKFGLDNLWFFDFFGILLGISLVFILLEIAAFNLWNHDTYFDWVLYFGLNILAAVLLLFFFIFST